MERSSAEEALARCTAREELIVVGAHAHNRAAGIVLGETATQLVHHSTIPVLVARERPLADGVLAATRARPADRPALTTATRIAARRRSSLWSTFTSATTTTEPSCKPSSPTPAPCSVAARVYKPAGPTAPTIVETAEGDGSGLVVLGSRAEPACRP